ncbi:MAG: type II toxin-antitoxin system VapC family toxin [Oscillospiraceae bacterium]
MKAMIDTNIIIDVLTEREPYFQKSHDVLSLCEKKMINGFVTASTITDIFYIVRRHTHNTEIAYKCLGFLLDIVKVLPVTNDNVVAAFMARSKDFEDRLLAECALANNCAYIITRNTDDFADFGVPLLTPDEAIKKFDK